MHENLDLLDKKTRRSLVQVYEQFWRKPDFPLNFCSRVADEVKARLGFLNHNGAFLLDIPWEDDDPIYEPGTSFLIAYGHSFSTDRYNNVIDLTLAQFNPWLNEPVTEGVIVIPPGSAKLMRYLKEEVYFPFEPNKIEPYFS